MPGEAYTEESPLHHHPLRPRGVECACVQRRQVAQWAEAEAWEGRGGGGQVKMTTPIEFNGGRGLAKGAACYASTETCVETSILHVGRAGAAIRIVEIHGCHARERDAAVREYSARCAGDREAGNSCQSCSLSWATVQGPAINAPPITTPDHPRTAASTAGRHKSSGLHSRRARAAASCASVLRRCAAPHPIQPSRAASPRDARAQAHPRTPPCMRSPAPRYAHEAV